ncbi:uncharacterized protein LOC116165062 [Photinus pyralis]|uniref:uncharacterized protein LOC116165062 n=1 Tax=Photinus pyralis TaxID=7054 RepID=UPI0012675699|nr:uncharacterized protein LOC116165062 [Photinus pyralis]
MRIVIASLSLCLFLTLGKSQSFGGYGFHQAFAGGLDASLGLRDPRQNTGPVVFPPAPPDSGETSGVIPGASGYGFVPPGQSAGRPQALHSFF